VIRSARGCLLFSLLVLGIGTGCPSGTDAPTDTPEAPEGSAASGSAGEPAPEGSAEPSAGDPPPTTDEVAEVADTPEVPEPPPLVEIMRRAGYTDAADADLAEFVHVPPGAEGEAGSFGDGEGEARVAFVRYPNDRYARPHVTDVAERRRILPELGEAIVAEGRFVAHVRAVDRVTADAVANRIADSLGWSPVASP